MNTADDLLRRALNSLDGDFPGVIEKLKRDISAYLDAPKDEPIGWEERLKAMRVTSSDDRTAPTKTAPKKPMTEEAEDEAFNSASKYAAWLETENRILREAKKPMTEREMTDAYYEADTNQYEAFVEGIRFAERHHFGIGERDE